MLQVQRQEWYEALRIPAAGLFVSGIAPQLWGKEWKIDFLYDPLTDNKPFRMRFKDCTVGHWEFYGEAGDEHEEIADVIGFDFCSNEAGKFVVLHTDCFEVIIHYGTLEVDKDW